MLARKFEEDSPFHGAMAVDESGVVFLDTDPATFAWILGYLRRGCQLAGTPPQPLLEQVRADADYFGLTGLVEALDEKLHSITNATYTYDHRLIGPLDHNGEAKRKEYERSIDMVNMMGRDGYRVAHAAVDADGTYLDCLLEKKV